MNPEILRRIFSKEMLIALAMGFSSGLPLLLTLSTLQAWMKESGVDLKTLGFYTALIGLPYSFKFIWAPIFDRFALPLGRRRGWLLLIQLLLTAAIFSMSLLSPKSELIGVAVASLAITFFSASQDILVDAYRRESLLREEELGLASGLYVAGYRAAMLVASGGALILADQYGFAVTYKIMSACMLLGILTTLLAPEPSAPAAVPRSFNEAVVLPLTEYFNREGAILTLVFIFLYKVGDIIAGHITMPFYLDLGFTKTEVGTIVKFWGFWATIAGGLIGGALTMRLGYARALLWFGILQMLSTAGFIALAQAGHNTAVLAAVVAFENLTAGMGTSAFVGFMGALTNKRFTATQYALLSSLMALPRVTVTAGAGALQQALGWSGFFLFCTLIAIPGLILAAYVTRWLKEPGDAAHGKTT